MKSTLITGGANGIGRGIALELLKQGQKVIVVSSSNGEGFINKTKELNVRNRAIYIQADLSLISENNRVLEEVKKHTDSLDTVIFCAARHNLEYIETKEGIESSFSLDYLSRFILSYGLKELLENAPSPIILNLCGTGLNGEVNWEDMQHQTTFKPMKVMMHGSRLNELSAVAFTQNDKSTNIKYILYNPSAVKTDGMKNFYKNPILRKLTGLMSKSIEEATENIIDLLDNPPSDLLSAFNQKKKISLNKPTFDKSKATRLFNETTKLLELKSKEIISNKDS